MAIRADLLEKLACPKCRGPVELTARPGEEGGLACRSCRLLYEIKDDIPAMLVDLARPLEP